jgi:hypothetical protein
MGRKKDIDLDHLKRHVELLATYRKSGKNVVSRKSYRLLLEGAREASKLTDDLISANDFVSAAADLGLHGKLASRFYQVACDKNQSLFTVLVMGRRHYSPENLERMRFAIDYIDRKKMSKPTLNILPTQWIHMAVSAIGASYPKVQKAPDLQILPGPGH